MSMIIRTQALRAAARNVARPQQQVRALHVENTVDHVLPTSVRNKAWFATKFVVYAATGFGLPFFSVWYHNKKAANGGVF
ncbi:uncharacterized protein LOC62_04G006518 [Vanrija pseudolonga]|uniref:Cytochrome c oxidase subunit 8, mitochondrial n=1 Tax=Vanrija pseudolonga TaxID=143232 RepID=A0AAF1BND7_9TREE|nr:hypothetical protein LOC62_04G006518 [Vanrija pseudolonga]